MTPFHPFDPNGRVEQTWRNLPHWQQPGATYFVTFRLGDSLPHDVCLRLAELRRLNDSDAFAWMERYLDAGAGACLFSQPPHARLMESALRHFDSTRFELGAYTVMPNHVHVIVQPIGLCTLTEVTHGWKSYTANRLQRAGGISGTVWQEESFDRIIRDDVELRQFREYVLANPAAARLRAGTFISGEGSARWLT